MSTVTTRGNRYDPPQSTRFRCMFKGAFEISFPFSLFFGGVFVTVLASTAYDIYLRYTKSQKNLLVMFSLYTNSKKLLSTRLENSSLTCLYGLKFFSMLWIAFDHFLLVRAVLPNSNGIYTATEVSTFVSISLLSC
jgi:hypothetical protein